MGLHLCKVASHRGGLSLQGCVSAGWSISGWSVLMGFHCTSVAEGNDNETDGHCNDGIGSDFDSTVR